MRNETSKYKVFPVQYVKGFCPTICLTMERAMKVRKEMMDATGVEWRVRVV